MHTDRCHARQTNNTGMRVAILGKIGPPDKEVKEGEADPFNNMAADNRQQALRKQLTRDISRRRNLPTRNSAYRGKGLSRSQSDGSIWPHLLPLTEVGFRFHPCCINKHSNISLRSIRQIMAPVPRVNGMLEYQVVDVTLVLLLCLYTCVFVMNGTSR